MEWMTHGDTHYLGALSRCIWALVDDELAEHMISTTEPSAKQWLFTMMESMSHEAFIRMAVTLWATWWATKGNT